MTELKITLGKVEKSNLGSITYHEQTVPILIANDILEQLMYDGYWPVGATINDFNTPICNSQNLQPA